MYILVLLLFAIYLSLGGSFHSKRSACNELSLKKASLSAVPTTAEQVYNIEKTASVLSSYDDEMISLLFAAVGRRSLAESAVENVFLSPPIDSTSFSSSLVEITKGMEEWRSALFHGKEPNDVQWIREPLRTEVLNTLRLFEVPRLTTVHPELITFVLKEILQMVVDFEELVDEKVRGLDIAGELDFGNVYEESENDITVESEVTPWQRDMSSRQQSILESGTLEIMDDVAKALIRKFKAAWGPALTGLTVLDEMYGPDHGLLSLQDGRGKGVGTGFGLFDGIWKHVGWQQISQIQVRIKEMKELGQLLRNIGRRPTADGFELRKMPPSRECDRPVQLPMGVALSNRVPKEMTGFQYSDTIEGLLPSEMMLLSSSVRRESSVKSAVDGDHDEDISKKLHGSHRKLLFLSRKVEKLLASYELVGWVDQPTRSLKNSRRRNPRLPTTVGGPIILCLDTSWSMAGPRENLAKAVVVEASIMAVRDNRPCYVLAFSGAGNLAECEVSPDAAASSEAAAAAASKKSTGLGLGASKAGLQALLAFVGMSFRGGTDVTPPLLRAMDLIEGDKHYSTSDREKWASADIILLTDGELQSPPLPDDVMRRVRSLEISRGLEVHGLLVGRDFSAPLEQLCTHWDGGNRVHDFLNKYDLLTGLRKEVD